MNTRGRIHSTNIPAKHVYLIISGNIFFATGGVELLKAELVWSRFVATRCNVMPIFMIVGYVSILPIFLRVACGKRHEPHALLGHGELITLKHDTVLI